MHHDDILAPPNGGYGWVVTLLAATNMFFSAGILSSIGNLLDNFVEVCATCRFHLSRNKLIQSISYFQYFETSHSVIGMAFSLYTFTASFFGIVTNVLINRFGCRFVVFIGGAVPNLSYFGYEVNSGDGISQSYY